MAYLAGQKLRASELQLVPVQVTESTAQTSLSSTTYIAGSVNCETTFVAPASGRVMVLVSANANGAGANRTRVGFEVRVTNVSGVVVQPTDDKNALMTDWSTAADCSSPLTIVSGLTSGTTYYVRTMHKVLGGTTSAVFERRITVVPTF